MMVVAPLPVFEAARLQALLALDVLDTGSDPVLDGLVRSASVLCSAPIALVTLVDSHRQVFKARVGIDSEGTPRDLAFCGHAILDEGLFEVPDAQADTRFADNPLVVGEPHVRFYAGVPIGAAGLAVGTLCVLDREPRRLGAAQRQGLVDLARAVSHWLEHRRAQLALQDSQARLADIMQAASDWLWEADAHGHLTWSTPGLHDALGMANDDAFSSAALLDELGQPTEPPRLLAELLRIPNRFRLVLVAQRTTREPRHFNLSAVPRFDAQGRHTGWRGVVKDVSDIVLARRAAAERWRPLAKIGTHVPGVIFQYRAWPDGHSAFPYASQGIEAIYEVSPEEVRHDATRVFGRLHPDDSERVRAGIERSRHHLTPWRMEYRVNLPRRGLRWIEGHSTPERLADGSTIWHGFITDVTERREVEQLRREMLATERTARAKSEFFSRASHELRTPLNAIIGFTQLLQHDDDLPARARAQLGHVQHAGGRLLDLVNDMLELARSEQDQRPISMAPVSARRAVERSMALIDPLAREHGLALIAPMAGADFTVLADPRALDQALLNLLSNAAKYNRRGGWILITLTEQDGRGCIGVVDTGPGLTAEQQSHLYEPFNRLGAEHSGLPGSGLGLVITRQLIEQMNGSLEVHSEVGVGCRFVIALPLARTPRGAWAGEAQTGLRNEDPAPTGPATRPVAHSRPIMLYVEDDPVSGLLLTAVLEQIAEVKVASTLRTALEHLGQSTPALVISDINLPDGTGLDLVQHLRSSPALSKVPCIALSANARREQAQAALDRGFDDYWIKPLDIAVVREEVAERLRTAAS
jgi:PAS domain S-box-containing protein